MNVLDIKNDLVAEQESLDRIMVPLAPEQWELATSSPGWSVRAQIAHLTYFDGTATQAVRDPDGFVTTVAALLASMEDGNTADGGTADGDITLDWARDLPADELLARWRSGREELASAAETLADDDRVPWYGPSMGAKSFLTARLMECWAHGQDIADAVGAQRPPTDRLQHIARLGFITRGWSYVNRGLDAPDSAVRVVLDAPSGGLWRYGDEDADEVIEGPAEDFCLVVTQRRHVDDTALVVTGEAARDWMLRAQAFAGAATDGPEPA